MNGNIVLFGGSNNGNLVVGIQYNPVPGGPAGTKIAGAQVTVLAEGNMSNQVQGVPSMSRYSETDTGGMFIDDILTYSYTPTGFDTPWGGVNPGTTTFTITIQFTINPDGTISNFLIRQRMNH